MRELLKKKYQKENRMKYLSGILLSLAASFMICLYAPLQLYTTNLGEFQFGSSVLISVILKTFLTAFAVSIFVMTVLYCVSEKVYAIFCAVYFVAFFATYIQGNYLIAKIPVLDGSPVDWGLYTSQNVITAIVWLAVAGLTVFLFLKYNGKFFKVICGVSGFVMAMLAVSVVILYFAKGADLKKDTGLFVDQSSMLEMSEDENFVIFLVDCIDARVLSKLMDEHPEYENVFADFTYYTNAMSTYPYTEQSIPYILTGNWYENKETYEKYLSYAYNHSPLFGELESRGYTLNLYDAELPWFEDAERFDNMLVTDKASMDTKRLGKLELKTTGYTYLPYFLKKYCVYSNTDFSALRKVDADKLTASSLGSGGVYQRFLADDHSFYKHLLDAQVTKKREKAFKFIHIEGGHSPYRWDENVNPYKEATYETNIQASITIIARYLSMLKKSGVYDNSVIMLISDHGYEGGKMQGLDRQNPALFIKGRNESHAMRRSDAPISYVDLQEAYVKLLDGAAGDDVFPYHEGDFRSRRYLLYALNDKEHMYEYIHEGHASDSAAMYRTGKVYELRKTNALGGAIVKPFAKLIVWIHNRTGNMFWAILIFTLITEAVVLLLSIGIKTGCRKGDSHTLGVIVTAAVRLLVLLLSVYAIKAAMNMRPGLNTAIGKLDLRLISDNGADYALLTPFLAAFSAWLLCHLMNKYDILMSGWKKVGKYTIMLLFIALSLYIGWFMSVGAVVFLIAGNVFGILRMCISNAVSASVDSKVESA